MHAFVWEKKASFSYMERERLVNHPKNRDACICMGEKGFIFILEACKPPQKLRCMYLYRRKMLHFNLGGFTIHSIERCGKRCRFRHSGIKIP
jgi:hypothetical protein